MYLVGITGQIASGKTSVARMYKEMGAFLIDADKIGHKLLKDSEIKKQLVKEFGEEILDDDNEVIRDELGAKVFSSSDNLEAINKIMSKRIVSEIREVIAELQENRFPGIVVIDAALFPKWDIVKAMDIVILIEAPKWQRLNRLVRQRGLTPEDSNRRIDVQEELFKEFYPRQTIVVNNNGDFVGLRVQAMSAWLEIKDKTKEKTGR